MKLIDSFEFIKNLTLDTSKGFYGEFMDGSEIAYTSREIDAAVENAPTIDAVLVVRCRECKKAKPGGSGYVWCGKEAMPLNGFCSEGKRKEVNNVRNN